MALSPLNDTLRDANGSILDDYVWKYIVPCHIDASMACPA
jgi:hypothetical protein